MKIKKKIESIQKWLPYERILEDGIIKMKNNSYIKIIEVKPINYNLKSNLEKDAILNAYKTFLKTCSFNLQIIVQSNKEDLSHNIDIINENLKSEKNKLNLIGNNYIRYIKYLNQKKESSKKKLFILIQNSNIKKQININENSIINELNEKFYKIKETLIRCGNDVINIEYPEEIIKILKSFLNFEGKKGDEDIF